GPMKPYTSPFSSLIVSRSRAYRSPYILVKSRVSIMLRSKPLGYGAGFTGKIIRMNVSWLMIPDRLGRGLPEPGTSSSQGKGGKGLLLARFSGAACGGGSLPKTSASGTVLCCGPLLA